jgi:hypothetical protein
MPIWVLILRSSRCIHCSCPPFFSCVAPSVGAQHQTAAASFARATSPASCFQPCTYLPLCLPQERCTNSSPHRPRPPSQTRANRNLFSAAPTTSHHLPLRALT